VLVVVDFDLKFTYVLVGWEILSYDAIILANTIGPLDVIYIPDGKFYLRSAFILASQVHICSHSTLSPPKLSLFLHLHSSQLDLRVWYC
jgi:hypothetical protein